jgi:hypothetical protein
VPGEARPQIAGEWVHARMQDAHDRRSPQSEEHPDVFRAAQVS